MNRLVLLIVAPVMLVGVLACSVWDACTGWWDAAKGAWKDCE